jgi:hypothetical protein
MNMEVVVFLFVKFEVLTALLLIVKSLLKCEVL